MSPLTIIAFAFPLKALKFFATRGSLHLRATASLIKKRAECKKIIIFGSINCQWTIDNCTCEKKLYHWKAAHFGKDIVDSSVDENLLSQQQKIGQSNKFTSLSRAMVSIIDLHFTLSYSRDSAVVQVRFSSYFRDF